MLELFLAERRRELHRDPYGLSDLTAGIRERWDRDHDSDREALPCFELVAVF
jgi:hypothetical protein